MNDPKPYVVKYKANRDSTIKPGIHGRFETEEEAKYQCLKAREFFDMGFGGPNAAKVGIVIDQAALAQKKRLEEIDDGLGETDTILEAGPLESVPFLCEILEEGHGFTNEDADKLVRKHAKIVTRMVNAKGPMSLKIGREIVAAILRAEDSPTEENRVSELEAEVKRLSEELARKESNNITEMGNRKGKKKNAPVEEDVPV